jgi:spermidine synthase
VIGVGTGAMMNALQLDDRVKSIDVVEVNETLIDNLLMIKDISQGFSDKRVNLTVDDGRRFLERTTEKFDLITIDALRTRSAFSNNIYSHQFFDLAKSRLSNDGKFLVWSDDSTGDIAKTLALSFKYIDLYSQVGIYSYFMIASNTTILRYPEIYENLRSKLDNMISNDVHSRLAPVLCYREGIIRATVEASINTDLRPNLEYYLGTIGKSTLSFNQCSE